MDVKKPIEMSDEELDTVTGGVFDLSEVGDKGYFGCYSPYAYALNHNASVATSGERKLKKLVAAGDIEGATAKAQSLYNWLLNNNFKKEAAAFKTAYGRYLPS